MSGNHRVVAAIDFGTHGTGFAWAVVNETNREMTQREIFYFEDWGSQQVVYAKNLSALVLDRDGKLLEWGYAAEALWYSEGPVQGRRYFSGYKMALQANMSKKKEVKVGEGDGVLSDQVDDVQNLIRLCLRQVYEKAIDHIKRGGIYTEDDIRWCITVPAIWDDYTTDLMYAAAVQAGLPDDRERLLLSPEPEAAALYCIVKGEEALQRPGQVFMVVDAGGGTIDITSYRVEPGRKLSQLAAANGNKAGSEYLNRFFVTEVLCDRFGVGFIEKISKKHPHVLYQLVKSWEGLKRTVTTTYAKNLTLPLTAEMYALVAKDAEASARFAERQGTVGTAIIIPAQEARDVFERVVSTVVEETRQQLARMRTAAGTSGSEVAILVGGFAESPYLRERLTEYLASEGVALHIPQRPSLAVLAGATHFAYDPSVIRARRAPLTYGVGTAKLFRKGVDPKAKRFEDEDGQVLCADRFDVFVANGDPVDTDSFERSTYVPVYEAQTGLQIDVFSTRAADPEYTTQAGVDQVASIEISLEKSMHLPRDKRAVEVKMFFGESRVRVEAKNLDSGENNHAEIKWKPTW
ncbi:Hsp70 family protein [Planotetraspora sp. A-T 1434]|uniref:Hsp70 family protein n=1 Tax=Planotetraspora sp. A-T 1434 TaxID=2979219 RepID=UPI0021BE2646|nr:Hsp70 family protein [Planotetraspora sp. A-T 1434]MCT9933454.1 Hsp70 family protein [Planotetraspora sp. A-T 1434]